MKRQSTIQDRLDAHDADSAEPWHNFEKQVFNRKLTYGPKACDICGNILQNNDIVVLGKENASTEWRVR